jgi:enamine deaminase RidA (YjgF/YER057c/UK114 family)
MSLVTSEVTDYGVAPVAAGGVAPIPDAVAAHGIIVTAQIPLRADGTMEEGDTAAQTRAVLDCLQSTLASMGLGLDRVMHATVYLTNMEEWDQMNAVWQSVFTDRSPSRAAIGTTALARPGMRVEMVVLVAQN